MLTRNSGNPCNDVNHVNVLAGILVFSCIVVLDHVNNTVMLITHVIVLVCVMVLALISEEHEGAPIYWSRAPIYWSP